MSRYSINWICKIRPGFITCVFLLLAMAFQPGQVKAQSPITARAEPARLPIDEQLTLNVTVSGDFLNIPNPDLDQLQDFVVVSSSTSTQVSIINGKMSSQKIFIFRLQPLREGNLIIAPISVNIDGQVFQTDPIQIEVLSSSVPFTAPGQDVPGTAAPDTLDGQDFFVEAEVDNPTPYLGEQIIYTFRLFQASNFLGQPDYKPPAFTDFWSSEILSQPRYNTEAEGRQYLVTEIRAALFPANLGEITIDPATLVIPGGLFNPDVKLETNPVQVQVKPLPDGAPEDFSGAVGQYEITARLSESETKVNEPVTLRIDIEGTGNIQTVTEPQMPELNNWRIFESQTSTKVENSRDILRGTRTFERLVVPGQAGDLTFPPVSFSYYDPQSERYQTISSQPIPISVLPDDAAAAPPPVIVRPDGDNRLTVELASADIRHIKPAPSSLRFPAGAASAGEIALACLWALPVLLVSSAFVWQRRRQRLQEDVAFARDVRARREALRLLVQAETATHSADAAGRALLRYLSDKLNTPTVGLTTDNLIKLLQENRLDPTLVERVKILMYQIDIERFAPVAGSRTRLINDTKQLIQDLEKAFGKRR